MNHSIAVSGREVERIHCLERVLFEDVSCSSLGGEEEVFGASANELKVRV